jgi:small subunit ribosomal protein S18
MSEQREEGGGFRDREGSGGFRDREGSGGFRDRDGGGGGFRDREGGGFREGRRERGPMSPKARLRAKARKKARKAAKKGKGSIRKKVCRFCADANVEIDYKDPKTLRYFITETGKVIPQRISGNCARHQREVGTAVKRGRQLALLPYAPSHI